MAKFLADGHYLDAWTVRQHLDEIGDGDAFALWRSGPASGVVGLGHVVGPATPRDTGLNDDDYWMDGYQPVLIRWPGFHDNVPGLTGPVVTADRAPIRPSDAREVTPSRCPLVVHPWRGAFFASPAAGRKRAPHRRYRASSSGLSGAHISR